MIYLDEQIPLTFTNLTGIEGGMYRYSILMSYSVIFTGNLYLDASATTTTIQVGDIVRNYKDKADALHLPFVDAHITSNNQLAPIQTFIAYLYLDEYGYNVAVSNEQEVAFMYRYPHHIEKMGIPFLDSSGTSESDKICDLLQGGANNKDHLTAQLLPHYPYVSTDQYAFAVSLQASRMHSIFYIPVTLTGSLTGSTTFEYDTYWFEEVKKLSTLYTALNPSVYTTDNSDLTAGGNLSWDATLGAYTSMNAEEHNRILSFDLEWGDGGDTINSIRINSIGIFSKTVTVPVYLDSVSSVNLLKSVGLTIYGMSSTGTDGSVNISFSDLPSDANNWVGKTIYVTYTVSNNSLAALGGVYSVKDISATTKSPASDAIDDVTMYIGIMPAAKIDTCPARYYLMWQDRGGSYQSQPFDGKSTYSEDIKRETMENYVHEKRDYNIQVTPKWKISSKWIPQDEYPYYESIFVSPRLVLYDVEEDVSYNVLVKGNYTEKKFRNEKKLISLELDLEEDKIQNIIY